MGLATTWPGIIAVTRARRERMAAGATVLRTRVATALSKRKGSPRAAAFEDLLRAIDGVLVALELEPEYQRLN